MNKKGRLYHIITFLDEYADELLNIITNGLGFAVIEILYELNEEILWGSIHSQKLGLILLLIVFTLNIILGIWLIEKKHNKKNSKIRLVLMPDGSCSFSALYSYINRCAKAAK